MTALDQVSGQPRLGDFREKQLACRLGVSRPGTLGRRDVYLLDSRWPAGSACRPSPGGSRCVQSSLR